MGSTASAHITKLMPKDCSSANEDRCYICIDLKSFYASVEAVDRGLDPMTVNLAVADPDRGQTTICLAITPAMKQLGIRNRCRVYEIPDNVQYVKAKPRMRHYMEVSAHIYGIYLRYVCKEDIHVYSIDECFIDITSYLGLYHQTAIEFSNMLRQAVFDDTGICATVGIGTNLFLAKVALDITAKHTKEHIGYVDQKTFVAKVGKHRPITDIWNVGPGIAERLSHYGVFDLCGVAAMDEDVLYREFGSNARYLIDHAHGIEPCTIAQIQAYKPKAQSLCSGQILPSDYTYDEALVVLKEMADALILDLVDRHAVAGSVSISIGYARQPGADSAGYNGSGASAYQGEHGTRPRTHRGNVTRKLPERTHSRSRLLPAFETLFAQTASHDRPIRRLSIGFGSILPEEFAEDNLFTDVQAENDEQHLQQAILAVRGKFGKNALLHGRSLTEKATARERNCQIGGHRA
ncbi:MAG: DNA repair protein [Eggerthellaceae bacterium]|nr:DNA repair protein [Eggerthellaceae bacterium]